MGLLTALRVALAPAPVEPMAEELEARWQALYDTQPGSPEEEAAYLAAAQAGVGVGRAA